MPKLDYYEVLGVERNSGDDEIKKAYRKLAMKYHPDKNPGDADAEQKFKEVGEAYAVLSNPQKRAQYDRFGHASPGNSGFGGFSAADIDPFEIFRSFMGGFGGFGDFDFGFIGRSRPRRQAGREIHLDTSLNLQEIAEGVTREFKIKRLDPCDNCEGSGAAPGSRKKTCPACGGTGAVRRTAMGGIFTQVTTCEACGGSGEIIVDTCPRCRGDGRIRNDRTITVNIPGGVTEGNYISLRGQGNIGPNNGPRGDIKVFIKEEEHPYFQRDGDDIIYNLQISFPQAALGSEVEIPTLNGKVMMTIPSGT